MTIVTISRLQKPLILKLSDQPRALKLLLACLICLSLFTLIGLAIDYFIH